MAGVNSKLAVLLAAAVLAGCGGGGDPAKSAADGTTRAVYNDDVNGVTQNFDDNLKTQVTRSEVGILSDQMHKLGDYKSLDFVTSDPAKNEYTYNAEFSNGTMKVVVRLDPDGKFSAYRVFPPAQ